MNACRDAPRRSTTRPMRSPMKKSLVARVGAMLVRAGIEQPSSENDLVAVKLHFGEPGNTGFVRPDLPAGGRRRGSRRAGGKPFLTDANTLYRGQAGERGRPPRDARSSNGFDVRDRSTRRSSSPTGSTAARPCDVPIAGFKHFETRADRLGGRPRRRARRRHALQGARGHRLRRARSRTSGWGSGCRSAKQRMHSDFKPEVARREVHRVRALREVVPGRGHRDRAGPRRARSTTRSATAAASASRSARTARSPSSGRPSPQDIQEKIVEHVAGRARRQGRQDRCSSNFVTDVSPDCDCWAFSDAPLVPDLGVLCSTDPVAIDQAASTWSNSVPGLAGLSRRGHGRRAWTSSRRSRASTGRSASRMPSVMGLGTRDVRTRRRSSSSGRIGRRGGSGDADRRGPQARVGHHVALQDPVAVRLLRRRGRGGGGGNFNYGYRQSARQRRAAPAAAGAGLPRVPRASWWPVLLGAPSSSSSCWHRVLDRLASRRGAASSAWRATPTRARRSAARDGWAHRLPLLGARVPPADPLRAADHPARRS